MSTNRADEKGYFIPLNKAEELLQKEIREQYDARLFQVMLDKLLIVTIREGNERYLWADELRICRYLLELNNKMDNAVVGTLSCNESFLVNTIKISNETVLIYEMCDYKKTVPAYVRNIIYLSRVGTVEKCAETKFELLGISIVTTDKRVRDYIENVAYRKYKLDCIKGSNFANSSSYMGSKKKLAGFIVEAMILHCGENSVFLDIMCGSGAVSNALAQMGTTYASDAQEFCILLAKIQGAGFSVERAHKIIKEAYIAYSDNLELLQKEFSNELSVEDEIFRMDLRNKKEVFDRYYAFCNSFELYSSNNPCSARIYQTIEPRKRNPNKKPYCLFTCYYANIFFGVAQCIQLDSIRYAIDQIRDKDDREWALGVLVVVTSAVATTYGGHFAQPKRLDMESMEKILIQRSKSAWLEFSRRLIAIAEESERCSNRINIIKGPWENALTQMRNINQMVVYLDAPYKREEYSRYYHVLETMVKYDYPSSEYKGRMRSKKLGERFRTEFFSKTSEKIEAAFEKLINTILDKKAICVWSYSDNGAVSLMNVVRRIREKRECNIYFYSIPYQHLIQGKKVRKGNTRIPVTEYCIVFVEE